LKTSEVLIGLFPWRWFLSPTPQHLFHFRTCTFFNTARPFPPPVPQIFAILKVDIPYTQRFQATKVNS
jgi:hypothetical protein